MNNQLIINSNLIETRIALLENNVLKELYIERKKDKGIVGNIYKGKVIRVLPGMQVAFVEIGLARSAFLHVADVHEDVETFEVLMGEGSGDIMDIDFINRIESRRSTLEIQDLLREGQEILVQVSKEAIGTKGARVTSHAALPGRFLVLMPNFDHLGVSRRIEDDKERKRLKKLVDSIRPRNFGFIIRTAAEGVNEEELNQDMNYLLTLWKDIQKRYEHGIAPTLIYNDLDLTLRSIRDLFSPQIAKILVDRKNEHEKILDFVNTFMPSNKDKIELYIGNEPIYDYYGIEVEIAEALGKKVWLKSGGYIVIDQTEALTAIDVNTGKYVGKRNLEDTILKTNLEAVREIAYQLRLRNIGGIIIIDFIDMDKESNRERVFKSLSDALKEDRARTSILKISELGLVEMTRRRTRESIGRTLSESCSYCDGRGYLKSKETICTELLREIEREAPKIRSKKIYTYTNPEIADILYDENRDAIEDLEQRLKKKIIIRSKKGFHQEQFEVQ